MGFYESDEKELYAHFACYALSEIAQCLRYIAENTPKLKK